MLDKSRTLVGQKTGYEKESKVCQIQIQRRTEYTE